MTIPSVVQGLVETEGGKVFELDSPKGVKWLESVGSFRYEPIGADKPYTVRQEKKKGGDYWYAYRKNKGVLHKRYIGATSSLSVPKLEEIAEALNTPQQSRVTEAVTDTVPHKPADDELTALKVQVQALQESLETLRDEVLGKSKADDTTETPRPDTEVTDNGLLIELSNLRAENEALRAQLEAKKTNWDGLWEELEDSKETCAQLERKLAVARRERDETIAEKDEVQTELEICRKQTVGDIELPEAAELLNKLRAKRKKTTASRADIETILEMMGE